MSAASDESGQLFVLTLVLLTMLVAVVALVVDGGAYLDARERAADLAAAAARAAAATLDPAALARGEISLETGGSAPATVVGDTFLAHAGLSGSCALTGDATVSCTVREPFLAPLPGLLGLGRTVVTVTASATDITGVPSGGS